MFERINVEEWQRVLSIASIVIFFSVFFVNLVRVRRMSSGAINRLQNLPLEDERHVRSK